MDNQSEVAKPILQFLGLPKNGDHTLHREAKVRLELIHKAVAVLFDALPPGATVEFKFRRGRIILPGANAIGEERIFIHKPASFLEGNGTADSAGESTLMGGENANQS